MVVEKTRRPMLVLPTIRISMYLASFWAPQSWRPPDSPFSSPYTSFRPLIPLLVTREMIVRVAACSGCREALAPLLLPPPSLRRGAQDFGSDPWPISGERGRE